MQEEDCPVCYRAFSSTIVPFVLACGHSFCEACSAVVRSCALCRHRISTNHPRKTNYSLLSLLEKLERNQQSERAEQQTQTDEDLTSTSSRRLNSLTPSFFAGRTMTVNVRKTGLHLAIK